MIDHYSFGSMTIQGKPYRSDLKIIKGVVVPDWWRKSGHLVEVEDLADVFAAEPDYLVLGSGSSGLMKVGEGVRTYCAAHGIELLPESTARAVETFNRLYDRGENVAAGFHLTC